MKNYIQNYFKTRKPIALIGDALFFILLILILIPATRVEVVAFIKRQVLFSPNVAVREDLGSLERADYGWPLTALKDEKALRLKEFRGKTVFINFWATWCPPCVAEMPSIQKLYNAYRNDESVAFVMISSEEREKLLQFMQDKDYDFPVYQNLFKVPASLTVEQLPTTYVIAPDGKIVLRETGASDWNSDKVHELINKLK